jgi:hypothetical protein
MIYEFNPHITLHQNWLAGDEWDFAAWLFASHKHREEFRNSGNNQHKSEILLSLRNRDLKLALAAGQFVALGIDFNDKASDAIKIPITIFNSSDFEIDHKLSTITALDRRFLQVRICKLNLKDGIESTKASKSGRPDLLDQFLAAWSELKSDNSDFLHWPKSRQNREAQERIAKLYPGQFPGNSRPGESTLRRHRRAHPNLFN